MIKAGLLRVQVLDVAAGNTCVLLCLNLIAAMKGLMTDSALLNAEGFVSKGNIACTTVISSNTSVIQYNCMFWSVESRFWELEVIAGMPYFAQSLLLQ